MIVAHPAQNISAAGATLNAGNGKVVSLIPA
jgi:hypothetical protein